MRIFRKLHQKLNWTSTRYVGVVVGLLALTYLTSAVYHSVKPLPDGLDYTGKLRHADVKFIADQTYIDAQGKQQQDHHIFNAVFQRLKMHKPRLCWICSCLTMKWGHLKHHNGL